MNPETVQAQLRGLFLEELDEQVTVWDRDLLALEQAAGADRRGRLVTLFRTAHSLKGAARSAGFAEVEAVCHRLEDLLAAARDGGVDLAPAHVQLMFAAADALRDAGRRLREGVALEDGPLADLYLRLEAVTADLGPATSGTPAPELAFVTAPAPAAEPAPEPAAAEAVGPTLRVRAEKLDALLAQSGELLVARQRVDARADQLLNLVDQVQRWRTDWDGVLAQCRALLRQAPRGGDGAPAGGAKLDQVVELADLEFRNWTAALDGLAAGLRHDSRQLRLVADNVQNQAYAVRMLPFALVGEGLRRTARDLAQATGKTVHLALEGGHVELDRAVLEGLRAPLTHLVRNAIDHGLEAPADRRQAGKPAEGTVTVTVALQGPQVVVTVADDGRGLDLAAIRKQAARRGLAVPEDERALTDLIFLPGFSTAAMVTDVSGRGVGLDAVRAAVEAMQGAVTFTSEPGRGTQFRLAVPLTLTTQRVVLVKAGGQPFALPSANVERVLLVSPADLALVQGREVLRLGDDLLPVALLRGLLGLAGAAAEAGMKVPAVVLASGTERAILVVDEVVAEQEIVVKALGPRLRRVWFVSGGTLLPSGKVALVLNGTSLVRAAAGAGRWAVAEAMAPRGPAAKKRLICVDDSLTTRTMVRTALEAAGYQVTAAGDGETAWRLLEEHGADLVVSDVDMPGMDGFMLTSAIRSAARFADLPVILITARGSDADRAKGVAVGASAYLTKSGFDQKVLLETVARLL